MAKNKNNKSNNYNAEFSDEVAEAAGVNTSNPAAQPAGKRSKRNKS